jgi:hypothetical protein
VVETSRDWPSPGGNQRLDLVRALVTDARNCLAVKQHSVA